MSVTSTIDWWADFRKKLRADEIVLQLANVLHPASKLRLSWDLSIFTMTIYTAIIIPYQFAFGFTEYARHSLFLDYFIDLMFIIDIVLRFYAPQTMDEVVKYDQKVISQRYLKGWFRIDVISQFPYDFIAIGLGIEYLAYLRIPRILRVLKLQNYVEKWEMEWKKFGTYFRIWLIFLTLIMISHWIACLWWLVGTKSMGSSWVDDKELGPASVARQYTASLYWSVTVLTTIGFGDITALNNPERIMSICTMLIGAFFYGLLFGNIASVLQVLDAESSRLLQNASKLHRYMTYHRLPRDLRSRIQKYFDIMWNREKGLDEQEILSDLPTALRSEVAVYIHRDIVNKVAFFHALENPGFINSLVLNLRPEVALPGEVIVREGDLPNEMFFLSRGAVEVTNNGQTLCVLKDGAYFGEVSLIFQERRTATVKAIEYCELLVLTKGDFDSSMNYFPEFSSMIKAIAKDRRGHKKFHSDAEVVGNYIKKSNTIQSQQSKDDEPEEKESRFSAVELYRQQRRRSITLAQNLKGVVGSNKAAPKTFREDTKLSKEDAEKLDRRRRSHVLQSDDAESTKPTGSSTPSKDKAAGVDSGHNDSPLTRSSSVEQTSKGSTIVVAGASVGATDSPKPKIDPLPSRKSRFASLLQRSSVGDVRMSSLKSEADSSASAQEQLATSQSNPDVSLDGLRHVIDVGDKPKPFTASSESASVSMVSPTPQDQAAQNTKVLPNAPIKDHQQIESSDQVEEKADVRSYLVSHHLLSESSPSHRKSELKPLGSSTDQDHSASESKSLSKSQSKDPLVIVTPPIEPEPAAKATMTVTIGTESSFAQIKADAQSSIENSSMSLALGNDSQSQIFQNGDISVDDSGDGSKFQAVVPKHIKLLQVINPRNEKSSSSLLSSSGGSFANFVLGLTKMNSQKSSSSLEQTDPAQAGPDVRKYQPLTPEEIEAKRKTFVQKYGFKENKDAPDNELNNTATLEKQDTRIELTTNDLLMKHSKRKHKVEVQSNSIVLLGTMSAAFVALGVGIQPVPLPSPRILLPEYKSRRLISMLAVTGTVYNIWAVPFQIGFHREIGWSFMPPNYFFDLVFIIDIIANFMTSFNDEDGKRVVNPFVIRRNYLAGWFWLDAASSLPLDLLVLYLGIDSIGLLRIPRFIRVSRLLQYANTIEQKLQLNPSMFRICKLFALFLAFAHTFACIWFVVPDVIDSDLDWRSAEGITTAGLFTKYITCLYFATTTLCTVGFGDITAVTDGEKQFMIIVMLMGSAMYSTVFGSMVTLVSSLNADVQANRQKLTNLEDYMNLRDLPSDLRDRIRHYYDIIWNRHKGLNEGQILNQMPYNLRSEVALFLYKDTLLKVNIFQGINNLSFINSIVLMLKPQMALPGEYIIRQDEIGKEMYFIVSGEVDIVANGNLVSKLSTGAYFGEISLIFSQKRTASVIAAEYCELLMLTKQNLDDVLDVFPEYSSMLRSIAKDRMKQQTFHSDKNIVMNHVQKHDQVWNKIKKGFKLGESRARLTSFGRDEASGGTPPKSPMIGSSGDLREEPRTPTMKAESSPFMRARGILDIGKNFIKPPSSPYLTGEAKSPRSPMIGGFFSLRDKTDIPQDPQITEIPKPSIPVSLLGDDDSSPSHLLEPSNPLQAASLE